MPAALPEETFYDFRERTALDQRRVPIEGTLETTFRCNLRCAHCYVNEPVGDFRVRDRELSTERLRQLVDELVDAGTLFVLFTGGEVLVRPDFPEVYRYAIARGMIVTVFTNGTLVTDEIADLFAEHRPDTIEVSLYGMTRETYERVTQVPGSYDKCIAGIRRLVARGLPLTLKTMALTWNVHEIEAMQAYAKGLGLDFRFDSLLNPRVDCGANRNSELQLAPRDALALDLRDPAKMEEMREFCEKFTRIDAERDSDEVYTCGAGLSSFTVDPYGSLQMCQLSRTNGWDLRQQTFAEGWNAHFPKLRGRKWQANDVCRRCTLMSICGSCPGAAEMETGSIEGIVAGFCEVAHLRAFAAMGHAEGHVEDASCCLDRARAAAIAVGGVENTVPLIQIQRRPVRRA